MTDDAAEQQICRDVPRETADELCTFVKMLVEESARQNLISAATLDQVWQRHILDSAQLLPLAGNTKGVWLDIGSGAGLPGMVIAILRRAPIVLIEPRAKRAAFLQRAVEALGLPHATVVAKMATTAPLVQAAVISARAVASLDALFVMGQRFSAPDTLWILPKGRSAREELAAAQASWQGDFQLVPSQTDSSAAIVVAQGVGPKS